MITTKYVKEFDALRAFSVLAVMVQHYFGQFKAFSVFGFGGVTMFFVLSGYLITQILLKEKLSLQIDAGHNFRRTKSVLKVFYIRRSLRIFPIYYLTLFVVAIMNIDTAREYFFYHFFYLTNFLWTWTDDIGRMTHFWSLAVEEQFYLIWPFLILVYPLRKNITHLFIFLIICSIGFRFSMLYTYSIKNQAMYCLMPSCMESFSFGALALLFAQREIKARLLFTLFAISGVVFAIMRYIDATQPISALTEIMITLERTVFSFFSAVVVLILVKPVELGFIRKIFLNKYLVLLGRISYGIYIYHMFVPQSLMYIQKYFGFSLAGTGLYMPLNFLITFGVAYLSFKLIETPINNLKKKFAYI